MVNTEWITDLLASEVNFMSEGLYDHCPAVVHWEEGSTNTSKPFKYFNMWKTTPDFQDKVKRSWEARCTGTKMYQLVGKLNRLKGVLKGLNKDSFNEEVLSAEQAKEQLWACQGKVQLDP